MSRRICIITSGQPSANPRVIKEATALDTAGYNVTVVYCPLSPWADEFDKQLFLKHPNIKWIRAGYHAVHQKWKYQFAKARRKLNNGIFYIIKSPLIAVRSIVLFEQELEKVALEQKADLFIGHNIGALPVVVKAAKYNNSKAAFDFEDFHRGETINQNVVNRIKCIEDNYASFLAYATVSSPLIKDKYKAIFPYLNLYTIYNSFSLKFAVEEIIDFKHKPLKIFWFSQFAGKGRGLELVIEAIAKTKKKDIELTLLGNCSSIIKNYFKSIAKKYGLTETQLNFFEPTSQEEIFRIASLHHIGIASEPGRDINNDIALSNKIFTYLLSGNAILFSATTGQKKFFDENPGIGFCYQPGIANELTQHLLEYYNNPQLLYKHRLNALEAGKKKHNWDVEKLHFLSVVEKAFE